MLLFVDRYWPSLPDDQATAHHLILAIRTTRTRREDYPAFYRAGFVDKRASGLDTGTHSV